MRIKDLPERLDALADSLVGDDWEHPLASVETCRQAAEELRRRAGCANERQGSCRGYKARKCQEPKP